MSSKRFLNTVGAWAFRKLQSRLAKKSAAKAERWGENLGRIGFRLSKKHRQRAFDNLTLAFPEKSKAERMKLAEGVLIHFGRVTADFMRARTRTDQELIDGTVEVLGQEHLEAALAAGTGAILLTGHFGNWERMSHWVASHHYRVSVVSRDANDPQMEALVRELREREGVNVISRGDAARPILKCLRQNEFVGILPDQNSEEIFVPFFGHPCGTVTGPAVLSMRSGAPLTPMYCTWVSPGMYRIDIEAPLEPDEGFEPVEGYTRAINRSLENAIRRAPDQYLWVHNRWKSARKRGLVP
jgi:Kdo2-lipid IVA lauroyltransferase/acyltransferase